MHGYTAMLEDLNSPLSVMDGTTREKIGKEK